MLTFRTLLRILHTLALLAISSVLGVVGATTVGTMCRFVMGERNAWQILWVYWLIGAMIAVPYALVLGAAAQIVFKRVGLRRWWQFVLVGLLLALPIWLTLASPLHYARWKVAGLFDTIDYLGSGTLAALIYWRMARRREA